MSTGGRWPVAILLLITLVIGWGLGIATAFLLEPYRYEQSEGRVVRIHRRKGKAELLIGHNWVKVVKQDTPAAADVDQE